MAPNLAPDQYLVPGTTSQLVINPVKPVLVVTTPNFVLTNVTIPATTSAPVLDVAPISTITSTATTMTIPTSLTVTTLNNNNHATVQVSFPASSTTVTGSTSWNGMIQLPTVQSTTTFTPPSSKGTINTPQVQINLGSSTPLTFNNAVSIRIAGQAGNHVGYFYDSGPVTEITQVCPSVDSVTTNTNYLSGLQDKICKINDGSDLVVWTMHFTGFGTWSSSTPSVSAAPPGSGGGAGSVGTGPSAAVGAFGGILVSPLKIDSISYNLCQNDTVKILVEYSGNNTSVIVRTSLTGIVEATPDAVQPYAQENQNSTVQKVLYDAHINQNETSFEVVVLQGEGQNVNSVGQTVQVQGCQQVVNYPSTAVQAAPQVGSPEIFDVKYHLANGTDVPSSEESYVASQPLNVQAIINSPTPPTQVQLRFVPISSGTDSPYSSVNMTVTPLQVTNTTYTVLGTIPQGMMQAPAVTYWIDAQNAAGKAADSDHYTVGVKPSYPVVGNLEMDISTTRAQGTMDNPSAYFTNNSTGPVYGTISLIIDGNVTYTSTPQVFGVGQTAVNLQWKAPSTGTISDYNMQAVANIYDRSFETSGTTITTFPSVQTVAISQLSTIQMLNESNNTIAQPLVLYSSFNNEGTMQYNVTAPDGTCVIGGSSSCLVQNSTFSLPGSLKSVTIGDQIYRIRYSGPDSPLERFSITSVDPILGNWHVGIESQQSLLPQAHASEGVFLKIKYREINTSLITLYSP